MYYLQEWSLILEKKFCPNGTNQYSHMKQLNSYLHNHFGAREWQYRRKELGVIYQISEIHLMSLMF
jgi:hypothetical protein